MSEPSEPDLDTVADLLGEDGTRTIMEAVAASPRSPAEIAELADVSRQTVYRRLDRLQTAGLVSERTRPRADGHHETIYAATLTEFHLELTDEGFAFTVETEPPEPDPADELTRLWRNFHR